MADELRLKVSASDYIERIGMLDDKMNQLNSILDEYETLQKDSVRVLGDDDSNLENMRGTVQQNIDAVNGQIQMLAESREMLQKQMDQLQELSGNVENLFQQTRDLAKNSFKAVKIVSDMVN